ncbi:hypothetical protein BDV95DRAFT_625448 [Massariosphaeria phaeospora]|uniref:Carrier domain-containing protein n=1 Tax=Massariosphaeria phaeospora TaxID=100035 RepID=A0A7C8MDB3_9PLEO|nr:hypothetical protein BDV95DRAFT_625448 [Massariosphaeria phaeospora]
MATNHPRVSKWKNELTPNIVDHMAKIAPGAPYALYPNSPVTYDEGYRTVTYKDFANAINGLAWWLNETLGPSKEFDVLAYIGPNDIRYTALLLGAVKAGYVAFFTSPRNSIGAHEALFKQLKCRIMLTPDPTPPIVESILKAHSMRHLQVPSVADLLDKTHPHYEYDKTFEKARMEPLAVIHTSGSTGLPKPLIWTHETITRASNQGALKPPPGSQTLQGRFHGKRILNTFPPFHAAGLAIYLSNGVPFGTVSIALLSGAIPTAEGTHLEYVLYAGGDLPQVVGDVISAKLPIYSQYGASGVGFPCQLLRPGTSATNWHYVQFHPDLGLAFEEIAPKMFEMVVRRDARYEENQLPFSMGPSLQKLQDYRSRDLFEKHPTVSNCWAWRGRADDIIVFLNGEKTNPISMEQHIVARAKTVSAALVVDMQRFQAALLIEPAANLGELDPDAFIEQIWPVIEEANKTTPAHARIEKPMILLTTPNKSMIRSGKGTIQRQGTISQYATEIDDLYVKADITVSGVARASIDTENADQVSQFIQHTISKVSPGLLQEGTENFFALGMDSLMAMRLIRLLRHGLGQPDLNVSVIYNNPSVQQLTQYATGGQANSLAAPEQQPEMESLLAGYERVVETIPVHHHDVSDPVKQHPFGDVVLLTGSTGSLGTHLLQALLVNPAISHIYCLNRRQNAREIHEAKAESTGFQLEQYSDRFSCIHAILDQANLGIDDWTSKRLRSTTTLIIHSAWPVNFMMPLKAFRPQFDGLINLFRFATSSTHSPKLLYISSVSAAAQYSRTITPRAVPEEAIRDFNAPYDMGYGKSKLLSELLCDAAARTLGIATSFARVGQIAGPVNGPKRASLWNPAEILPSLIITSISLGALPDDLGAELDQIDWMPVDLLAPALVELGTSPPVAKHHGAQVFNVLNPRLTSWEKLLPSLISSVQKHANKRIEVVTVATWLQRLGEAAERYSTNAAHLVRTHPAIKLQEFYETNLQRGGNAVAWEMEHVMGKSTTIREMSAVGEEWVDKWVEGTLNTALPVRSAELKQCTGGLVVRWVTTSEYPLLYVF